MKWVIRFTDTGDFNRGNGFPVDISDATRYDSLQEGSDMADGLCGPLEVIPEPPPILPITKVKLADRNGTFAILSADGQWIDPHGGEFSVDGKLRLTELANLGGDTGHAVVDGREFDNIRVCVEFVTKPNV